MFHLVISSSLSSSSSSSSLLITTFKHFNRFPAPVSLRAMNLVHGGKGDKAEDLHAGRMGREKSKPDLEENVL